MSTQRILEDGTEVSATDDVTMPRTGIVDGGDRWSALYSLEEGDDGFAIVTFDRYGRAVRPHALESGRYPNPAAAFDAIRRWESDVLIAEAAARSA